MSQLFEIATIDEVPLGCAKAYVVDGRTIALYHTDEGFFATDNTCPHRGGPLAEGALVGNEINCPWHLWGFDVMSGVCVGNPELTVAVHEVLVEGDRILVNVP